MTSTIVRAADALSINAPRKPWLDELAKTYDFSRLPNPRTDEQLLLGVADDPARQSQPTVFYEPDKDGNMAIYGTGGSGKSAALRGIAIAAAITPRGGPVHATRGQDRAPPVAPAPGLRAVLARSRCGPTVRRDLR